MRDHARIQLPMADGGTVEALAPVIVSASRSTDIPAFYADWFFNRLNEGWSAWKNPFNGKYINVSYAKTRFIVFWSKNPRPLLSHLDALRDKGVGCYVHFSLNDYVEEGLEPNVPPVDQRIETFLALEEKLGFGGVIWRNDPLLLTDRIGHDELLRKCERIGDALKGYTEKLVFSFADITPKVAANLRRAGVKWQDWTEAGMREYAKLLSGMNGKWGYELATCAEAIDLEDFGIQHNHCVDEKLIIRRAWRDEQLMKYLGADIMDDSGLLCPVPRPADAIDLGGGRYALCRKDNSDKGQRTRCGCIKSKDIGEYSTCRHFCAYCYANDGRLAVEKKCRLHGNRPDSASISGAL